MEAFPNTVFTDSVGASETGFQGMGMQDKDAHQQRRPGRRARPEQRGPRRRQQRARPGHQRRQDRPPRPRRVGAGRLLQGPGEVRRDLPGRSTASATRCPATSPGSRRTARSPCSAAAPTASTPAARRSTPKRSRWRSRRHPAVYDVPRGRHPRREVRPGRRRRGPAARGRRPSSSRSCATSCASHLSGYKLPRALTLVDRDPAQRHRQGAVPPGQGAACSRPPSCRSGAAA